MGVGIYQKYQENDFQKIHAGMKKKFMLTWKKNSWHEKKIHVMKLQMYNLIIPIYMLFQIFAWNSHFGMAMSKKIKENVKCLRLVKITFL